MMTEPTDPAALSDEVATAIAWLRDHAATDDFGRDFSRNKRHGAIADLLTRLSARVTEAERGRDEAKTQCHVLASDLAVAIGEKITAERRLASVERANETARAALTLIAAFRGKTLIGDDTYSVGAHDAFENCSHIAEDALAALQRPGE